MHPFHEETMSIQEGNLKIKYNQKKCTYTKMNFKSGFRKLDSELEAYNNSNCKKETKMQLALNTQTLKALESFGKSKKNDCTRIESDPKLQELLRLGTPSKCEVREIIALHHPARW
jgi:hypothetical protein